MDSSEGHNFQASITVPVSHHFGLQADALYSRISGQDLVGGAGHFFWRDPDLGFIGVAGGGLHQSGANTFLVGAEAGYYFGPFTLGLFAGVGSIDYDGSASFIDTNPTEFTGRLSADWYALADLRLGISGATTFGNYLVTGDIEYQTPISGLAFTGQIAGGDHGYDHWLLGVRYYFGAKKSLRDRQRQDDPPGLMPQILHGLGLYGAEVNHEGREYFATHPDQGTWNPGSSYIEINRLNTLDAVTPGGLPPLPPTPLDPPELPGGLLSP